MNADLLAGQCFPIDETLITQKLDADTMLSGCTALAFVYQASGDVDVGLSKFCRLYREYKFTVHKHRGCKRDLGSRSSMTTPQEPNRRRSLDFVSDALTDGSKFRVLCVIDGFSREYLATAADNSISGERMSRELNRIAAVRGYRLMVVSDNGTALTSNAILKWQQECFVTWHYIVSGSRCRMASSSHKTDACEMSASTSTCFQATGRHKASSQTGATTTITSVPARAGTGPHQSNLPTSPT